MTEADYAALERSWITREIADAAMLRRVDEHEARAIVGQPKRRDCAGILFSYYWADEQHPLTYRVRRDNPEWTTGKDGKPKPEAKYLAPPNDGNRLYLPPGLTLVQLQDASWTLALVEGEKKTLALLRLAHYETDEPRFVPIGIPGVWNWRGRNSKGTGPNGERIDLKGPIADLNRINWHGRRVLIVFDSNVHTNRDVKQARRALSRELTERGALVEFVNLPKDCGANGVDDVLAMWGPERVLELFENPTGSEEAPSPQFEARPEGMFRISSRGEHASVTQLSNYRASITADIRLDDGVETKREFEIEAELMGRKHRLAIAASEFARMDWAIEQMGASAITFPNQKDYARVAIQSFSMGAETRCIYTHTGWRQIDGRWIYLHAGGAIGESGVVAGVTVRLQDTLKHFEMRPPAGSESSSRAVRTSLGLVELGPPSISFPLHAATYRAVLGESDFTVHLVGETGAFKSELASLEQRHFGPAMDRKNLPANWMSTGNSIEVLAFYAKDTLLVVDDFAPHGNTAEIGRCHAQAERVIRAVGNHAGRGRLDSSARMREQKPPRGLILSTGEDIPHGHSVRARLFILELSKGAVDSDKLAQFQREAESGVLAEAMGAYVQWLAGHHESALTAFNLRVAQLRQAGGDYSHARTPDVVANLQAGFETYLEFAEAVGAIDTGKRQQLASRCWKALLEAGAAQAKHHKATEPTARFLDVLRACLASGRGHLASRQGLHPERSPESCGWRRDAQGNWSPLGDCIGWVDGDDLFLEPTASYRLANAAGRDSGEGITVTEQILKKRLHEKGRLASIDEKRETLTIRRQIAGSSKTVLHLFRPTLLPDEPENDASRGESAPEEKNVGFPCRVFGGSRGLPDKASVNGINNLDANCRVCRVSSAEESCLGSDPNVPQCVNESPRLEPTASERGSDSTAHGTELE